MNATEAYLKLTSEEVINKIKAAREKEVNSILTRIFYEINNCISEGFSGFYFHCSSQYHGFSKWEKLALEELVKQGYKVKKGWWPFNNSTREISWKDAKPVLANDVVKGML